MTLLYSFSSLLSEIKNYSSKFGTCLSSASCSTGLWIDAKLKVRRDTSLICYVCKDITGLKAVALTWDNIRHMQANLLVVKDTTNIKKTKNLLCFAFNNRKRDKIPLRL